MPTQKITGAYINARTKQGGGPILMLEFSDGREAGISLTPNQYQFFKAQGVEDRQIPAHKRSSVFCL